MILKSIRLKNFRKFKDSFIEFPDGVTGVVGLNGVGKSTIFEAVAWSLYGPVAARTATDQIKRVGASPSEPCWVELEFIFDENTYHIVREMSGKNLSASGSATINGKLAANGAEPLSRFIHKKLGMDWKSFYTSIFAKQKELNTLSSMNPGERRQLILRMLGINAVDDIISEIRSDTKEKKNLVEKLGADLVDEHGTDKITQYSQEIENQQKKQKELSQRMEEQKKHHRKIEEDLSKIKKDCETKKLSYEKLCTTTEQLEGKKSKYEKKQRLENDIRTLEKTLHERQHLYEKQKENLTVFKNLDKDLQTFDQQQETNNTLIQTMGKKQEQNATILHRLRDDIKELSTKKHRIEIMGPQAKCPTCERILGEQQKKLLVAYTEELTKKNNEAQRLNEEAKKLQMEHERISREKQALQKKGIYLRSQVVEREKHQSSLRHTTEETQRENRQLESMNKELKTIGAVVFDEKQYQLIRVHVGEAYKIYQETLTKLDNVKERHQEITVGLKEQEGKKNLISQAIKTFEKNIEEQQKIIKKLQSERTDAQRLSMLSEVMDSYRTYLISQIRPTLSAHASELFDELTDGKYSQIELDEDYNLLVYDQGLPYSIERFSGGEEDLANLCIRLAISEIITERAGSVFQFIILDEIFGSQDQIRKQNIIRALNSFSSKFRQIFLITHVDDIKHFTEHTMMVSEDESGISTIQIE
ncbi:MAG TPA: SMC family ATPase [Thermoplasmata archaeon]|jgi:DNA repair protein SbcC/Rad50|nr:MAG TPA: SMC family ATPase [Thermoplasmata archaeon]